MSQIRHFDGEDDTGWWKAHFWIDWKKRRRKRNWRYINERVRKSDNKETGQ